MEIQAIETKFNGYTFRSRLEARFAALFTQMGIKWFYEYEGYQTSTGFYLPDFWLPDVYVRDRRGTLLEVKPKNHADSNHAQLYEVAEKLGTNGLLVKGFEMNEWDEFLNIYQIAPNWDCYMQPFQCPYCKNVLISYNGGSYYEQCPHCKKTGDRSFTHHYEALRKGYEYALRYRFW